MAVLLNRVLPHKLNIFDAIVCFDVFEPWPLKIIGMFVWIILILFVPSLINSRR